MTDEELDSARAKEAIEICAAKTMFTDVIGIAITAARLAREGWTPTDPDLIEARECVALLYERQGFTVDAQRARAGEFDDSDPVQSALLAIQRVKGKGQALSSLEKTNEQ